MKHEGEVGTWSHCGSREPHGTHEHTVVFNEGPYYGVVCLGYDPNPKPVDNPPAKVYDPNRAVPVPDHLMEEITMEEPVKHETTCTDEKVRGYRGTVARCTCGWEDRWAIQDGNAEASAHDHMINNDPEYAREYEERMAEWEAGREAREAQLQADREAYWATIPLGPKNKPVELHTSRDHDCTCHLHPPCSHCEHCRHFELPEDECDEDCQTCEKHEDRLW